MDKGKVIIGEGLSLPIREIYFAEGRTFVKTPWHDDAEGFRAYSVVAPDGTVIWHSTSTMRRPEYGIPTAICWSYQATDVESPNGRSTWVRRD